MTPSEIRAARQRLGLTQKQLAGLLETAPHVIFRMEAAEGTPSHRPPAARMLRLLRAYLAGYRPPDWP